MVALCQSVHIPEGDPDLVRAKIMTGGTAKRPDLHGTPPGKTTVLKVRWCIAQALWTDFKEASETEAVQTEFQQPSLVEVLTSLPAELIGRAEEPLEEILRTRHQVSSTMAECLATALSDEMEPLCLDLERRLTGEKDFQRNLAQVANNVHGLTQTMSPEFVSHFLMIHLKARHGAKVAANYAADLKQGFQPLAPGDNVERWLIDHLQFIDVDDLVV